MKVLIRGTRGAASQSPRGFDPNGRKAYRFDVMQVESALLERLILPRTGSLPAEAAKYFLALDFPASDRDRVKVLSAKARDGTLSDTEQEQLDGYVFLSDLLALLQSKARLPFAGNRD
jgi:hypothetical protein